jgi:hypothetical protein
MFKPYRNNNQYKTHYNQQMTSEQINRILEFKRIPLTFKMAFNHYFLAIMMAVIGCFCIYEFIWTDLISGAEGLLILGILCLLPAVYIFFYLGKKQLKLQKVQLRFLDDRSAYLKAKDVFAYYKWDILEENGTNYIKALRKDSLFGKQLDNRGRAIFVFIEKGYIYAISLYHPQTQSEFFGITARNIKLFERRINELTLINKQPNAD